MKHLLSVCCMVAMICMSAKGEEVTFSFRGTVHEMDGEFNYFTGQPFEITFSFESTTEDADPENPESGSYTGAIKSGMLTIFKDKEPVNWIVEPDGSHNIIEVKNLDTEDAYLMSVSISGPVVGREIHASFIVELIDKDADALSNDALPSSLKVESFSDQRVVKFTFISGPQTYSTLGIITDSSTPAPR